MSVPAGSEPAGTLIVAFPERMPGLRVTAAEVNVPLVSTTEPVGEGLPLTNTATPRPTAVVMLGADGVTVMVGVVLAGAVTVTEFDPVPEL
jgi:hypothetical protein